jgi:hypothetical protein
MKRTITIIIGALALAACGSDSPASKDNTNLNHNNDTRTVYDNPEDFNNVVVFCDGTTRVYVTTEYRPTFITDHPLCGGLGRGQVVEQTGGG